MNAEQSSGWSDLIALSRRANDAGYAEFVSKFPFEWYRARVEDIQFSGFEQVLDVGCGYGQWSLALAERNKHVTALEINVTRLKIAGDLAAERNIDNIDFVHGNGRDLPFSDESFDALFCYGVFMFMDRRQALLEFRRVLKPGGRLYVCTNGQGWWLKMLRENLFKASSLRAAGWRGFFRGRGDATPNATQRRDVGKLLPPSHWSDVRAEFEGHIRQSEADPPRTAYENSYLGFDSVIEFTATKGNASDKIEFSWNVIKSAVERTISQSNVDWSERLREFEQPKPASDLVNNTDAFKVRDALTISARIPRQEVLQWVFERVTRETSDAKSAARACLVFAQKHFYHHFAGQPMTAPGLTVVDPVASLVLQVGRCGAVARFLVDLFVCNGIEARLVTGGCHTAAEALIEGRWILVDANLYPAGIAPTNRAGEWLTLDDAALDPSALDRCPSYVSYNAKHITEFLAEYPETFTAIGRYLESPLLPSAAYFGAEFYAGREVAACERLTKTGTVAMWEADPNYGWGGLEKSGKVQGLPLPTRQRPGQAHALARQDNLLVWQKGGASVPDLPVSYEIFVAAEPRGWSYEQAPVGCRFEVQGHRIATTQSSVAVEALRPHGRFVSIVAKIPAWEGDNIFYLPSAEFQLN